MTRPLAPSTIRKPFDSKGKAIEQYNAQEAIESLSSAPSQSAAEAIFRLLDPAVKAQLRRVVHAAAGGRS